MIEKDMAPKASGKHCFTLLTVLRIRWKRSRHRCFEIVMNMRQITDNDLRDKTNRSTARRWLKLSFLEDLGHAQATDALRGPVSIAVKENLACSERLTWRDNKKCAYFILHGTSLRIASHVT